MEVAENEQSAAEPSPRGRSTSDRLGVGRCCWFRCRGLFARWFCRWHFLRWRSPCRRRCWLVIWRRMLDVSGSGPSIWHGRCRGRRLEFTKVIVDKRKAGKLFLIDCLNDGRINRGQCRLFRRKILVKVCSVSSRFLQHIKNKAVLQAVQIKW